MQESNVKLQVNDSLQTKLNSRAHINLVDNSEVILTESSRIYFEGIKKVARPEGKVLFHSKDRDEVYRKAREFHPNHSAILFTGKLPDNVAVIL